MNPRIENVACEGKNNLILTFKNGEVKIFDVRPYLKYPVYKELQDEAFFKKAKVFNGTVCWDDAIDFDPDTLYLESKELQK
jgi:hypothetical protein